MDKTDRIIDEKVLIINRVGDQVIVTGVRDKRVKQLFIPSDVTFVHTSAFQNCDRLERIEVSSANKKYFSFDGILFSKTTNCILFIPPNHCSDLYGDVVLPDSEDYFEICTEFMGNKKISSVTIPSSIIVIYERAFEGCDNLKSIRFNSLRDICNMSFSCDDELAEPNYFNADDLYIDGKLVRDLLITNDIKTVSYGVFSGFKCIESLRIDSGVKTIEDKAFLRCSNLKTVTIDSLEIARVEAEIFEKTGVFENVEILYIKDDLDTVKCVPKYLKKSTSDRKNYAKYIRI